jgi:hypothetical protein
MRIRGLAEKLKQWYIDSSVKLEDGDESNSSRKIRLDELKDLRLTPEDLTPLTWKLAIHFCHLKIMWSRKELAQEIGQCEAQITYEYFFHTTEALFQLPRWQSFNILKRIPKHFLKTQWFQKNIIQIQNGETH